MLARLVSVFAHEIEGPASDLTVSIGAVERRARNALGEWYEVQVGQQIEAVKQSSSLLARFATLPLYLLRRNKRRRTVVDVNGTVGETVDLFQPYLQDAQVETVCEFADVTPLVRGSVAAIEAIVSNLITNSVKAFKRRGARLGDRTLALRTTTVADHVLICVLDSGPGIDTMPLYQFALTTPQTYHDTFSCVDPRPSFPRKRESIDPGEGEYGVIIHNWY